MVMEKKIFDKDTPLIEVAQPKINEKYHLAWAWHGCVWKLIELKDNGTCVMQTPTTKKTIVANVSDLRHLRKVQQRLETNDTQKLKLY
jgi:hypothetical protein